MSLTTDLVAYISTYPTLTAIQGDRFYPLSLPQEPVLPASHYAQVSARPDQDHDGVIQFDLPRYQFDVYAATYLQARALADALKAALVAWQDHRTIFETQQDINEAELARFRVSMDFFIEVEGGA